MQEFAVFVVPCDASYDPVCGSRSLGIFTALDFRRALEIARVIHADEIDPDHERLAIMPAYAAA